jgi:hypothetical protein
VPEHSPIILLIEDDEFDRITLTRLLRESGCRIMSVSDTADALDIFALNRSHIALILASLRLSDVQRIRLLEAVNRVDARTPVIVGAPRPSHRPNSGEDSGRSAIFADLIASVLRRLDHPAALPSTTVHHVSQAPPMPATHAPNPDPVLSWPPGNEELDDIESCRRGEIPVIEEQTCGDETTTHAAGAGAEPRPMRTGRRLPSLVMMAPRDLRSELAEEARTHRVRQHRLRTIGLAAAAGCVPVLIITLLPPPTTTTARALEQEVNVPAPIGSELPKLLLASTSLSTRVGLVPLVSGPRMQPSTLANDLVPTLHADLHTDKPRRTRPDRSRGYSFGRK